MSKSNVQKCIALILGVLASTAGNAWHEEVVRAGYGGGPVHHHGGEIVVPNPGYGYYDRGGYYYRRPNIVIPNIIINAAPPPPRYYAPQCQDVEVCNSYDECWLERYCN